MSYCKGRAYFILKFILKFQYLWDVFYSNGIGVDDDLFGN